MRPVLLDLYCCAGGAARGYDRVGFEVVGVDIDPELNEALPPAYTEYLGRQLIAQL